jgi:lactoylglutathione lyase
MSISSTVLSDSNIVYTIPFLAVSDMEASLNFYVNALGFEIVDSWTPRGKIEWCALKREGARLMLQEPVKDGVHKGFPREKVGVGVSIFFICRDALIIYDEVKDKGLKLSEPFVGNSMWVVSIRDPDDYSIEFESETDVPEHTLYSDWIRSK